MRKRAIASLITLLVIAVAVIFAGCVEEETPLSTHTPTPTVTPTPTPLAEQTKIASLIGDFNHGFSRRDNAIEALVEIGEPAVEPLIQALNNESWVVREAATEALGKIGDERAVEPLIKVLDDEDETTFVREAAAEALGEIGDERAIEPLAHALTDIDVLKNAAVALDKLGWAPQNESEKAYYLIAKNQWDELTRLGEPAVEPLIHTLTDMDVREEAVETLTRIGEPAVEPSFTL